MHRLPSSAMAGWPPRDHCRAANARTWLVISVGLSVQPQYATVCCDEYKLLIHIVDA
jgi:hypothetical protein